MNDYPNLRPAIIAAIDSQEPEALTTAGLAYTVEEVLTTLANEKLRLEILDCMEFEVGPYTREHWGHTWILVRPRNKPLT